MICDATFTVTGAARAEINFGNQIVSSDGTGTFLNAGELDLKLAPGVFDAVQFLLPVTNSGTLRTSNPFPPGGGPAPVSVAQFGAGFVNSGELILEGSGLHLAGPVAFDDGELGLADGFIEYYAVGVPDIASGDPGSFPRPDIALRGTGTIAAAGAAPFLDFSAGTTLGIDGVIAPGGGLDAPSVAAGALALATGGGEAAIGTVTIEAAGTILGPDAKLEIDIAPADADLVEMIGGSVTLGGMLSLSLVDGAGAGGTIDPAQTFVILSATGLGGSFANIASGERLSVGGGTFLVSYGAGSPFDPANVVLSAFVPVPLPGAALLFGPALGVLGLFRVRRAPGARLSA